MIVQIDRCLKPVWFDDQQIARQVFERAFGRGADKQAFPAISRDRTHDDDIGLEVVGDGRQFLVRQAGDEMRVIAVDAMKRRDFAEALLVILVHLLLDLVERQRDRNVGVGCGRRHGNPRVIGMKRMNVAADLSGNALGDVQDFIIQRRRLVVLVHRVDGCDEYGLNTKFTWLDQP